MSHHREAILGRRALFLSTALVAVGCPSKAPSETVAIVPATTAPAPEPSFEAPPLDSDWDKVLSAAPPRAVPASVSERERTWFQSLAEELDAEYEAVRIVWVAAPACDPAAESCRAWIELAEEARQMYRAVRGPWLACPGPRGRTATVMERREAHRRYIDALHARIEERLASLARRHGSAGVQAWQKLLVTAKEPPPRPCLKPCAQPDVEDLLVSVPFAKDDATLRLGDAEVDASLERARERQRLHGSRAQLVVRGHADSGESNARQLGEARARAVVAWLVAAGIPAIELKAESAGAELGVDRSGSSGNRRVDFLVVPR